MMYYSLMEAVRDNLDYEKTPGGGWRVTFRGAFTVSAESDSPNDASFKVQHELEHLLAKWILEPPEAASLGTDEPSLARKCRKNTKTPEKEGQ